MYVTTIIKELSFETAGNCRARAGGSGDMYCELTFTIDLPGAKPWLTWVCGCYRDRHCG